MARHRIEDAHVEAVMVAVRGDAHRCPIDTIHSDALNEYQLVKRRKRNELSIRRETSNVPISKMQKKRDINHASAVASRNKHEFLLRQFEATLRRKLAEAQVLSDAYSASRQKLTEQMRVLTEKDNEIATLRNQLAVYSARQQPHSSVPQLPIVEPQLPRQYIPFDSSPTSISKDNPTTTINSFRPPTLSTSPIHDVGIAMDEIISPIPPSYDSVNKEQQQQLATNSLVFQWSSRIGGEEMVKSDNVNPAA